MAPRLRLSITAFSLGLAVVSGVAGLAWLAAINGLPGHLHEGVDPGRQAAGIVADPAGFVRVLAATAMHQGGWYVRSFLGVLGWSNLFLPAFVYGGLIIAAPFALLAAKGAPAPLPKGALVWFALLMAAVVLLVEVALYVTWTPVGADQVEGVQGRYFLPLAPLAFYGLARLAAPARRIIKPDLSYAIMLSLLALASLETIVRTVRFFGLF
jgi:uncharacterized membrane protein